MKHSLLFLAALSISALAQAETYKLDEGHTTVGFKIKHLVISTVNGRFNKFTGSFAYDEKSGKLSDVMVSIDTASIDTNEAKRDEHLRSKDFFEVEKFPKIQFKSTKVDYKNHKPVKVTGDLTIRDVTHPVTLTAKYEGSAKDPWGNTHLAFNLSGKIDRKDFGLSWNKALETGGLLVANEVAIEINSEALLQEKAK